jgi:hypothetical protein
LCAFTQQYILLQQTCKKQAIEWPDLQKLGSLQNLGNCWLATLAKPLGEGK